MVEPFLLVVGRTRGGVYTREWSEGDGADELGSVIMQKLDRLATPAGYGTLLDLKRYLHEMKKAGLRSIFRWLVLSAAIEARLKPDERSSLLLEILIDALETYKDAAEHGIDYAIRKVENNVNWGSWWASLAGNLIWATACFTSGPAAFVISVVGIGVGTLGAMPQSQPEFREQATATVNAIYDNMKSRLNEITEDAYRTLKEQGWDDRRLRRYMLSRLLKSEYIETLTGGIDYPSREKIEHRTRVELFTVANRQELPPYPSQTNALIRYNYLVTGHTPKGYQYGDPLEPMGQWRFEFVEAEMRLDAGGRAAVQEFKRFDPTISPSSLPFAKFVAISSPDERGFIWLVLDARNQILRTHRNVVFYGVDEHALLRQLWRGTQGVPPDIETSRTR
jgi:hypothetical protein